MKLHKQLNYILLVLLTFNTAVLIGKSVDSSPNLSKESDDYNYENLILESQVDKKPLPSSQNRNKENLLIIYNRVPKTASTSLIGLCYRLHKSNDFNVIHVNISMNNHVLSLAEQSDFVRNITNWEERKTAIYHGHFSFIDFGKFGKPNPIYINLVREPLDRLISYYYYMQYDSDFRPTLSPESSHSDKETFDECVDRAGKDCDSSNLWLQIPFFCGQDVQCWIPGNKWALEEAKRNLIHHYLIVGLTEDLNNFVTILEATLPRFFTGAKNNFISGKNSHLRKTLKKIPPSERTIAKIKESVVWQMENEFYQFAKLQYDFIKGKIFANQDLLLLREKEITYEKIKP